MLYVNEAWSGTERRDEVTGRLRSLLWSFNRIRFILYVNGLTQTAIMKEFCIPNMYRSCSTTFVNSQWRKTNLYYWVCSFIMQDAKLLFQRTSILLSGLYISPPILISTSSIYSLLGQPFPRLATIFFKQVQIRIIYENI